MRRRRGRRVAGVRLAMASKSSVWKVPGPLAFLVAISPAMPISPVAKSAAVDIGMFSWLAAAVQVAVMTFSMQPVPVMEASCGVPLEQRQVLVPSVI